VRTAGLIGGEWRLLAGSSRPFGDMRRPDLATSKLLVERDYRHLRGPLRGKQVPLNALDLRHIMTWTLPL
jgi:hypothetical protein